MVEWPARSRLLTLFTFAFGLAFFFWIGLEDTTLLPVMILGASLTAIGLTHFLMRRFGGGPLPARKGMLLLSAGGLLGGGVAPLASTVLMALKVSLHSHAYPDYPPEAVVSVLARAPVWALAGLIFGVALACLAYTQQPVGSLP